VTSTNCKYNNGVPLSAVFTGRCHCETYSTRLQDPSGKWINTFLRG